VVAKDAKLHEQLVCVGKIASRITGAPFDSFMTLRGLAYSARTSRSHGRNADGSGAMALNEQPGVERVYYPGLPESSGP